MGDGDDQITIGTVPLIADPNNKTIEYPDGVPVADTSNMTNGVSNQTIVYGEAGDDEFEVDHNIAELFLSGGAGDDRFVVNTFITVTDANGNVTNTANLYGGDGNNHYEHVVDAPIEINGGSGIDTVVITGTPLDDIFVITQYFVAGDGGITYYTNIEVIEVDSAGGDDQIYILSADPNVETIVDAGSGDDTIHIGGNHETLIIDPPPFTYQPPPFNVQLPPSFTYPSTGYGGSSNPVNGLTITLTRQYVLDTYGVDILTFDQNDEFRISLTEIGQAISDSQATFLSTPGNEILSGEPQPIPSDTTEDDPRAVDGLFNLIQRSQHMWSLDDSVVTTDKNGNPIMTITWNYPAYQRRAGKAVYATSTVVPDPYTFQPPPIALHVNPVYDVSSILGRVSIDGGETYETSVGDQLIVHNQQSGATTPTLDSRVNSGADGQSLGALIPSPTKSSASFELWFKPADLTQKQVLFETGGTTAGTSLVLDGSILRFTTAGNNLVYQISYALSSTDDFVHVVGTLDVGNTMALFVNGVQVGSTAISSSFWAGEDGTGISATNGTLGGDYGNNLGAYGPFNGSISAARVYGEPLSAEQVASLYQAAQIAPTYAEFDARAATRSTIPTAISSGRR